jgi:predicted AlkP superfamily phosphohydrolase/phosphomutase
MHKTKKTLVVGLDAVCWDYLDPLLLSGKMPTLKRFMDNGVWGTLQSTMPPWTPTAWSSIITGKNPGKHGIFDMIWKRPGSYEFIPTNSALRVGSPFWNTLNSNGITTGVVNAPFIYPVKPLDGFLVCGFGTPNSATEIAYPEEVADWIRDTFPDFKPVVEAEVLATAPPHEIYLAEKNQQATFVEIAGTLANRYDVDVLVINLMFPDHANHKMPEMAQVQEAYCQTDKDLARLIDVFCPDNVMILSDHGSGRLKGDFMLDAWLRDQGYYVTLRHTPSEYEAVFNWLLRHYFQDYLEWSGIKEKAARGFVKKIFFRLPNWVQESFWHKLETIYPDARQYLLWSGRADYSATQVFTGSIYSGLLYLNLVNRDKHGTIAFDEKKALLNDIATKLIEVKDPETGKPLFDNVYFAEDIYSGPEVPNAPDLILDGYASGWNLRVRKDYFPAPSRSIIDRYFVVDASQRDFGWHIREGIFVFSGEAFGEGEAAFEAYLPDIPATLLHLYGVPLPEGYDGQVRKEAMIAEYGTRSVTYQSSDDAEREIEQYSPKEAEELVNHLKALGYLG